MRGGTGYISSLEDLNTWFLKNPRAEWTLLQGFQDGVTQKGVIYKQSDALLAQEDSWDLLKMMIEMNAGPGARFTVFVPTNEHGNRGNTVKIQLGEAPNPYHVASLGGYPGQMQSAAMTKAEFQLELAREKKLWDLEREVEELKAPRVNGFGDVLKEKLMEADLEPVLKGIMDTVNILVRSVVQKHEPLAVSLHGSPLDEKPATEQPQQTGYTYIGERLIPCLDRIRPYFTDDEEFYTYMDKLSLKFLENPTLFKSMFP